jgi:Helicase associated domain.
MHGVISKGNNGATETLQCPFARRHDHHGQNQSTPEDPVATNMSLPLLGPAPAPDAGPDPNPPLASLLDDTCPLESNCQSIHDEIIPPEHEELKKGYAGKTCPFLEESTGLGDQEEEEEEAEEAEEMNDQEMIKGHVSLFHSTISPSYRHEQVLGQEEEENVGENNREAESMNRCPYHKSSSGNSSQCGPHDVMQNLQPSIMSNNSSTFLETNHLPISNLLSCPPPAPQTAAQARRQMDDILSAQKKAQEEIHLCQQRLQKAQQDLDRAMMQQSSLDQMARDSAESWTDMLLQDDKKNVKWNNMYRKLEAYKAKHGHCDVKRQLTKKEKEMDPDLAALSQWVGKNRNEGRKAAEEGGDRSDRMEPYKIAALNRLGFDWAPRDNAWMQNYERVKAYLEKNPGKLPQRRKSELGVWANGQIIEYNKFMAGNSKAYITHQKIDF